MAAVERHGPRLRDTVSNGKNFRAGMIASWVPAMTRVGTLIDASSAVLSGRAAMARWANAIPAGVHRRMRPQPGRRCVPRPAPAGSAGARPSARRLTRRSAPAPRVPPSPGGRLASRRRQLPRAYCTAPVRGSAPAPAATGRRRGSHPSRVRRRRRDRSSVNRASSSTAPANPSRVGSPSGGGGDAPQPHRSTRMQRMPSDRAATWWSHCEASSVNACRNSTASPVPRSWMAGSISVCADSRLRR